MNPPRVPSDDPVLKKGVNARTRGRREFMGRLGVYLLGVAIGLVIVGMIWQARRASMIRAGVDPNQSMFPQVSPTPAAPR